MAACAHVWHYKCISRLLHSPDYPMFQCPNCRAFTDLTAEVDDSNDYHPGGEEEKDALAQATNPETVRSETQSPAHGPVPGDATNSTANFVREALPLDESLAPREEPDLVTDVENLHLQDESRPDPDTEDSRSTDSPSASNEHLERSATANIPGWQPTQPLSVPTAAHLRVDTPNRSETSDDNPLTPRNDSGPLAFDGRAGMR